MSIFAGLGGWRESRAGRATGPGELIACRDCDLLQRRVVLARGATATCGRCGAELDRHRYNSPYLSLVLALLALEALVLANAFPLVVMEVQGQRQQTTLIGAAVALYDQGMVLLPLLVLLTTVVAPGLELVFILGLLWSILTGRGRASFGATFALLQPVREWAMTDVLMLGILVALVKLAALAEVVPGLALWSYGAVILLSAGLSASFNTTDVWKWFEASRASPREAAP